MRIERLPDADWVTMSQAGLTPVRAGRFYVRTPDHPPPCPDGDAGATAVDLLIPAGLAFGTGQHATTSACLTTLDHLAESGAHFANILDLGTGTGLLALAAARLWPGARATASDIDPVAVAVARENAALNGFAEGDGPGAVALIVADGMDDPALEARGPFDLLIANILAPPLIAMAPGIAAGLAPSGVLILAGLLDQQAEAVAAAYHPWGVTQVAATGGQWPCLTLQRV